MYRLSLLRKPRAQSYRPLRIQLRVEELESRMVLTVFTPGQITHAYGFDNYLIGGARGDGSGQTIAIVDAYDAPKVSADLAFFSNNFGLPVPAPGDFEVKYPQGKPAGNTGWAQESTLDVEWAHAIAPGRRFCSSKPLRTASPICSGPSIMPVTSLACRSCR